MAGKNETSWEDKFEQRMKKLEKRMEEMGSRVEEKGEEFGKRMESKAKKFQERMEKKGHHGHNLFWGIVLIAMGFVWLGNNLDWFDYDIPWVPVVMIALGLFIIIRNWEKDGRTKEGESKEKE
jgi:hypothetical protein